MRRIDMGSNCRRPATGDRRPATGGDRRSRAESLWLRRQITETKRPAHPPADRIRIPVLALPLQPRTDCAVESWVFRGGDTSVERVIPSFESVQTAEKLRETDGIVDAFR